MHAENWEEKRKGKMGCSRREFWGGGWHSGNWEEREGGVVAELGRRNGAKVVEARAGRGGGERGFLNHLVHPKPTELASSLVRPSV